MGAGRGMRKRCAGESQARPDVRCLVGCALPCGGDGAIRRALAGRAPPGERQAPAFHWLPRKPKGNRFFKVQDEKVKGNKRMAIERTLSIIKPDATERNPTGKINTFFEDLWIAYRGSKVFV